jgi:hypothetical protein
VGENSYLYTIICNNTFHHDKVPFNIKITKNAGTLSDLVEIASRIPSGPRKVKLAELALF